MEILFFISFIALFGILAYVSYQAKKKRLDALHAFALANGLSFNPDRDISLKARYPFFSAFHRGHSQYAYNILKGNYKNKDVLAFDYHYAVTVHTKNGTRTQHYHFSAVILRTDFPLKELAIRPEGLLDKIGEFVGLDDIDFESNEFSRKFFVTAKEKKFAYGMIHQGMMEYLLENPNYLIHTNRNEILIYQNKVFQPEEFAKCLDVGVGMIERIPEYLIKELNEDPA
ncbi:MAG TPA: hypothetical protein PLO93_04525 [Candidatus Omnitrophota bacterium]|nr:hypothetical protein [Candidatus Omnitrophota bacterium]HQL41543.1 hypothetical protein [Candidatus Omnitrophota bacterium]